MFRRLLTISGIGPKLAISVLSGLPVRELKNALINGDIKRISSISGIGKACTKSKRSELMAQLHVYPKADAMIDDVVKGAAKQLKPETTVEDLIRLALTK